MYMYLSVEFVATVESAGVKVKHVFIANDTGAIFIVVCGGHERRLSDGYLLTSATRGRLDRSKEMRIMKKFVLMCTCMCVCAYGSARVRERVCMHHTVRVCYMYCCERLIVASSVGESQISSANSGERKSMFTSS